MCKTDGWRRKSPHFRFTSLKLRWSGGPYVNITFSYHTFYPPFLRLQADVGLDYIHDLSSLACPSILTDKEGYLWGVYSRHIGLDKRVTELLAIIWENAKVYEILARAMIGAGSDIAPGKSKMNAEKSRWRNCFDDERWLFQCRFWRVSSLDNVFTSTEPDSVMALCLLPFPPLKSWIALKAG